MSCGHKQSTATLISFIYLGFSDHKDHSVNSDQKTVWRCNLWLQIIREDYFPPRTQYKGWVNFLDTSDDQVLGLSFTSCPPMSCIPIAGNAPNLWHSVKDLRVQASLDPHLLGFLFLLRSGDSLFLFHISDVSSTRRIVQTTQFYIMLKKNFLFLLNI